MSTSATPKDQLRRVIDDPVPIGVRVEVGTLEGVAPEARDVGQPKLHEGFRPLVHLDGALDGQVEFIVANPDGHDVAIIAEVHQRIPGALLHLAGNVRDHVVAIEVDLVGFLAGL